MIEIKDVSGEIFFFTKEQGYHWAIHENRITVIQSINDLQTTLTFERRNLIYYKTFKQNPT